MSQNSHLSKNVLAWWIDCWKELELEDVGQFQLILNNCQQVSHHIVNLSSNIGGPSEGLSALLSGYSVINQRRKPHRSYVQTGSVCFKFHFPPCARRGSHVACLLERDLVGLIMDLPSYFRLLAAGWLFHLPWVCLVVPVVRVVCNSPRRV